MDRAGISAVKVALIYATFAVLWILFSDMTVELLLDNAQLRALAQTYKGLMFVIITALLLLMLVLRGNRLLEPMIWTASLGCTALVCLCVLSI